MFSRTWMLQAPLFVQGSITAVKASSPAGAHADPNWWVSLFWAAGVALMALRALAGRVALAPVRRRSVFAGWEEGIEVRVGQVQTPVLTGLLRPAILLPEASRAWTGQQRRMVLTHELHHYRQRDAWTNLLGQVVRAAFWFHPLVWLLVSRLSREQELACDEAVVDSGHSPRDYAAFLLDTVRSLTSREIFACAMAGSGPRTLKARFANLLDEVPRPVLTRRIIIAAATLAMATTALTVVRPVLSQNKLAGDPSKVYKVGGDVTHPSVLTKVEPQYSEAARAAKISGPVHLQLIVSPEGKPENIEVTDGLGYGLDENAIDAISQWTFQPATKDGRPVAVTANVLVNFKLL
ncbi:MAG TPA: M56 family metallopeptidase [Bryobacteraceae bacterium]